MKVSIITPLFNRSTTIDRCIQSVLHQTHLDIEHIIMDAKSTDGSVDQVEKYLPNPKIIFDSQKDHGIYDGMNRGLQRASGEWVLFLGGDDYLATQDAIKKTLESVRPDTDLLLGRAIYENGKVFVSRFSNSLLFRNSVHHQGCLYRRNLFKAKRFNTDYRVYSDYDFNLYLLKCIHLKTEDRDVILSVCGNRGVSDTPKLKNYFEEIQIRHHYYSLPASLLFDGLCLARFAFKTIKNSIMGLV